MLWTLRQAADLIAELEPAVRALKYHTCLGGGVLHHGMSAHDLDLWFIPLNGSNSDPGKMYDLLHPIFGPLTPLRDGPDYQAGEPYHVREMLGGNYLGKRVDIFIL